MLHRFSVWWAVNDVLPKEVQAIGLLSYAARPNEGELTHGSMRTQRVALELMRTYPQARLYWGVYSEDRVSAQIETRRKRQIFNEYFPGRHVFVGKVSSSTDECEAMMKAAGEVAEFVVVAEGWHSRRAKVVWEYLFKKKVYFRSVLGIFCADPQNPMWFQKYSIVWMLFNMVFLPLYKWFPGVGWFAKQNFHQPS